MESYKSYFDRQTVSPELHEKLLAIGRQPRTERRHRPPSPAWKKWAALAACCVLVLGAGQLLSDAPFVRGAFAVSPSESGTSSSSAGPAAVPEDGQDAADCNGFWWRARRPRIPSPSTPSPPSAIRVWTAGQR